MRGTEKVVARIYVEGSRGGLPWVPYNTLIGYGIGNRVIIGSRGEHFYMNQEFSNRQSAIDAAKAKAREVVQAKFAEAGEIRWDVVEEGACAFIKG
jgi:hypothetical protein